MANELTQQYPLFGNNPDRVVQAFRLPIGATGAPGTISGGGAGWSFTRSSAGTYTFTFPKVVDTAIQIALESPAGTVKYHVLTAISATNGTGGFITYNTAGTATDPASGDVIHFLAVHKYKGVD